MPYIRVVFQLFLHEKPQHVSTRQARAKLPVCCMPQHHLPPPLSKLSVVAVVKLVAVAGRICTNCPTDNQIIMYDLPCSANLLLAAKSCKSFKRPMTGTTSARKSTRRAPSRRRHACDSGRHGRARQRSRFWRHC